MVKKILFSSIFLLIFFVYFVSAANVLDELHLNIQTTDQSTGEILPGTFNFAFNITTNSDCTGVVYSNLTTLTTDSRGIVSYYLQNININFTQQYYLCYYRNGVLINSSQISRSPYSFTAKNTTLSGLIIDQNLNMGSYNITAAYFNGLWNGSSDYYLKSNPFGFYNSTTLPISGSGSINGSGTYGYIPFWNSSTSINNSNIYQNGSNIGIGTTTPTQLLTIVRTSDNGGLPRTTGTDGIQTYGNFRLNNGNAVLDIGGNSDGTQWLQITDKTNFATNYNLLLNPNGGNVGIGTTAPVKKLDVVGGINLTGNFYNTNGFIFDIGGITWEMNGVTFRPSADNSLYFGYPNYAPYATYTHRLYSDEINSYTSNGLINFDSGAMVLNTSSNNVGINTTTPQNTLNVVGDINATGNIYGNNTYAYYNITNWNNPYGYYNSTTGVTGYVTGAQLAGNITNFYLNTTNQFSYVNTTNFGNLNNIYLNTSNQFGYYNSTTLVNAGIGNFSAWNNQSNSTVYFGGQNSSYYMPNNKSNYGQFDWNGGWTANGLSIINGNIYAQTGYFYNISSLQVSTLIINGSMIPYSGFDNQFDIGSSSVRWRNIYAGGFVNASTDVCAGSKCLSGLLTTESDPYWSDNFTKYNASWSSVVNTSYYEKTNPYSFYNSTNLPSSVSGSGTAGYISKWNGTTSLNNSLIYDNGTGVGIGTASPAKKLTVEGGNIRLGGTANDGLEMEYWRNGAQVGAIGSYGGVFTMYNGASANYQFILASNYASFWDDKVYFKSDGKVGINTTTPQNTLNVVGDINATGNIYGNNTYAYYNITNWNNPYGYYNSTTGVTGYVTGAQLAGNITNFYLNTTNQFGYYNSTTLPSSGTGSVNGSGTLQYIPMWNSSTSINNSNIYQLGGNIGINTTTPQNALNVVGIINATGNIYAKGVLLGSGTGDVNGAMLAGNITNFYRNTTNQFGYFNTSNDFVWNNTYGYYNSTNPPIGFVTGSGVVGNITMWNGTTSINSSVIYQKSGKIGIGTNNPVRVLEVEGDLGTTILVASSGIYNNNYLPSGANSLYFKNSTSGLIMILQENGKVGINISTPSSTLNVVGDANITGNIYGNNTYGYYNVTTLPASTTYNANGTLLRLIGTNFSLKEGTLTNGKYCTYSTTDGLVCNSDSGAIVESDPYWSDNFTKYNSSWSSVVNTSYYVDNTHNYWNSTFATFNKTYADTLYATSAQIANFYLNTTNQFGYLNSTTISNAELDPRWSGNLSNFSSVYTFVNNGTFYLKTTNAFNYWNSTFATFNKTYADTLYATSAQIANFYLNTTNQFNYWNSTFATFNKTYADTLYASVGSGVTGAQLAGNITNFYMNTTNAFNYWNSTFATFNKTYADTLYATWTNILNGTLATWGQAMNGTLYQDNTHNYWNSTFATFNKTYADTLYAATGSGVTGAQLAGNITNFYMNTTNQFGYYNSTTLVESDPKWSGNQSSYTSQTYANATYTKLINNVANLNMTNNNITMDQGSKICFNQACTSYILNNGTASIWV